MAKFTLYRQGLIMGTHEGATEADAWSALCAEEKHADFDAMAKRHGLTKDGYDPQFTATGIINRPHFLAVPVKE